MISAAVLVLLLAARGSVGASGVWFSLTEGKERCFLEEVPKDTVLLARFKALQKDAANPVFQGDQLANVGVTAVAYDPDGVEVLRREMPAEGRVALTSMQGGEYKFCLGTSKTGWFAGKEMKFHLSVDSGVDAVDYGEVAKRDHLSALEVDIRRLNDRIRDVRAEQNYQRSREARFRNTSESTNARVAWWSVIQTTILVATGLWQITHLKSFFKEKKLV